MNVCRQIHANIHIPSNIRNLKQTYINIIYLYLSNLYYLCTIFIIFYMLEWFWCLCLYIYIYIYLCMYFYIFINGDLSELMSEVFVIIYMVMDIMAISEYIYQSGHYHLKIINVIWFI